MSILCILAFLHLQICSGRRFPAPGEKVCIHICLSPDNKGKLSRRPVLDLAENYATLFAIGVGHACQRHNTRSSRLLLRTVHGKSQRVYR
jgi:hypothetical protein